MFHDQELKPWRVETDGATMDCFKCSKEVGSAIEVMREARRQMRQWMNGRQTNYERTVLTQYAGSLVVAIDVLQMNHEHKLARIAGLMIRRIGRLAHS